MKLFNALQVMKLIKEPSLLEATYNGFMSIYESIDPHFFMDNIWNQTYSVALKDMTEYLDKANDKDSYRELLSPIADSIAMSEVKARPQYKEFTKYLEDNFDDDTQDFFIKVTEELRKVLSGNNTYLDYEAILPDEAIVELAMLFDNKSEMVKNINMYIQYTKLLDLIHKVKSVFIPKMIKLAV